MWSLSKGWDPWILFQMPHPATAPAEHREQQMCAWQWLGVRTTFLSNPFPAGTTINPSPRDGFQLKESKIPLRFHWGFCCLLHVATAWTTPGKAQSSIPYPAMGKGRNCTGWTFLQPTWMEISPAGLDSWASKEGSSRKTLAGKYSVSMRQNTTNLVLLKLYCAIPRNFSSSVAKSGKQFLIAAFCSFPV